jgi:hypothetical protein
MNCIDRVGADKGANRVLRGGSWGNNPDNCRSAYRNYNHPANRNQNIGLRLFSSLCGRKRLVYGRCAGAAIMTRPLPRAGVTGQREPGPAAFSRTFCLENGGRLFFFKQ